MIECFVEGRTLPDAYHMALQELNAKGRVVDCPAWNTRCREVAMTMQVKHPLCEPRISRFFPGGPTDLQQYEMEMLSGILDWAVDAGKEPYTYHKRMTERFGFDYVDKEWVPYDQAWGVITTLRLDPNSRRAVIDLWDTENDWTARDVPCINHIQFMIRDGLLDCFVLMRSNDALEATFMNAWAIIRLQESIAKELDVGVGTYTHRANSFHCYEKDWAMLRTAADHTLTHAESTVTYRYRGDWQEQMGEAVPEILAKMEALKNDQN